AATSQSEHQTPNTECLFSDVLVGDVWLCAGQSNMGFPMSAAEGGKEAASAPHSPMIRLLRIPERTALAPQEDMHACWSNSTAEAVSDFSAAGFFFADRLQRELGRPIGMIQAAHGGTVAEAFMSPEALAAPAFRPITATWEQWMKEYPATPEERAKVGEQRRRKLVAAGKIPPPWPLDPWPPDHYHRPSLLFNGMIRPLIPYSIRGVLWYQGEANGWRACQYRDLLPALIADWRRQWGQTALPVLLVQLPPFEVDWLEKDVWAELREAQLLVSQHVPHTAMVETLDLADGTDIHPPRKREVGERLALAALATVYGRKVTYSGPIYRSLRIEGDRVRLRFDHATGGLTAKDGQLHGFTVAGSDRRFVPAEAHIEGETILVGADSVRGPVAVRYGWCNAPVAALFNGAGLPASPFRTDNWPGITEGRVAPDEY
ncbi:MAG: sialate O-acetylesterase, partial [Kiritimatiellae bacterium]|nr:sialate O-acetylesterase [Kiritimatiellia bacterium]